MIVAVIQLPCGESLSATAVALAAAARLAGSQGASLLLASRVDKAVSEEANSLLSAELSADALWWVPSWEDLGGSSSVLARSAGPAEEPQRVLALAGDACFDRDELSAHAGSVDAVFIAPGAESALQAEAAIEFGIGLSLSVAGLVMIAESSEASGGGSAVVFLGEVLAEGVDDERLLMAEVPSWIPHPEPMLSVPELPPILKQRLAVHGGSKMPVDWLADLS